jgi:predicted lactoylglutathione lyase
MHAQIFVNLPVKDLKRSVEFFTKLGYTFDARFTDENATCMVLGENLAMLLVEEFFRTFTSKKIVNAHENVEVLTALSCTSRAEVDDIIAKARAAGATIPREAQDYGFMYTQSFQDLDGHTWELVHMSGMPPEA